MLAKDDIDEDEDDEDEDEKAEWIEFGFCAILLETLHPLLKLFFGPF